MPHSVACCIAAATSVKAAFIFSAASNLIRLILKLKNSSIELSVNQASKKFADLYQCSLQSDLSGIISEEWAEDLLDLLEEAYAEIGDRLSLSTQRSQVLVMETEDFRRFTTCRTGRVAFTTAKIRLPVPGITCALLQYAEQ